jgi:DNA-binding SARP family transcriptional activator
LNDHDLTLCGPHPLRFQLLGPVQAWRGPVEVHLGSPQQRSVLAVLLLRRNDLVGMDELTDALWGARLPRSATNTIRTYICRLRQILPPEAGFSIDSRGGGYQVSVPHAAVDAHVLRHRVEQGRATWRQGDRDGAVAELRAALELPRGRALIGAVGQYLDTRRHALEQLVAAATDDLCAIEIERGRHLEVISDLGSVVATHPLRERPRMLLMTALYRSGQPAEALAQFHDLRKLLHQELGTGPSDGLKSVQQRILRADPDLLGRPSRPGRLEPELSGVP